jgi:hypothetical protein
MSAAHAAAVAEQQRRHEEEELTSYRSQDLQGWEFKILRSATGAFRDPAKLQQALAEEATFGWELVEKFDDQRLRFKRPTASRSLPIPTGSDPYRTEFGMSEARLVFYVVSAITLGMAAIIGVIVLFVD